MDIRLRPATLDDLPGIVAMETQAEFAPFIYEWGAEHHRRKFDDPDCEYLIAAHPDRDWLGLVILAGITRPDRNIELVRILSCVLGEGYGSAIFECVQERAFKQLNAYRLWLDVFEDNTRARHVYTKFGFREEGLFVRAAKKQTGERVSLVIMGKLVSEYSAEHE